MWVLQLTWRSAGALPASRIQSYKHTAPPELGQVKPSISLPLKTNAPHKRPRSVRNDMWFLRITWRSAGALPAPRIQSYKHTAPPELGQVKPSISLPLKHIGHT